MPAYYVDTSALVKRYHVEAGSEHVDRLFADPDAILVTANFTLTELTSALDRKLQERVLTPEGLNQVLSWLHAIFSKRCGLSTSSRTTCAAVNA